MAAPCDGPVSPSWQRLRALLGRRYVGCARLPSSRNRSTRRRASSPAVLGSMHGTFGSVSRVFSCSCPPPSGSAATSSAPSAIASRPRSTPVRSGSRGVATPCSARTSSPSMVLTVAHLSCSRSRPRVSRSRPASRTRSRSFDLATISIVGGVLGFDRRARPDPRRHGRGGALRLGSRQRRPRRWSACSATCSRLPALYLATFLIGITSDAGDRRVRSRSSRCSCCSSAGAPSFASCGASCASRCRSSSSRDA